MYTERSPRQLYEACEHKKYVDYINGDVWTVYTKKSREILSEKTKVNSS